MLKSLMLGVDVLPAERSGTRVIFHLFRL